MLYTEPRVIAHPNELGFFKNFNQQELADLQYGGQQAGLEIRVNRPGENKTADTIPAPETPPSR